MCGIIGIVSGDPVADRLEKLGASRGMATAIITVVAILIFVLLALLVIPTLIQQSVQLFETAPQLFRDLQAFLTERFPTLMEQDDALRERPGRRVVVATAVAESSLTVPGVRVVVDAGLSREPRYDAGRGLGGAAPGAHVFPRGRPAPVAVAAAATARVQTLCPW